GSGRCAARMARIAPSVPPWHHTASMRPSELSCAAVLRCATSEAHRPEYRAITLIPGFAFHTDSAPALRSMSTCVPGTPVIMITLPLWPGRLFTMYWASCCPNLYWSVLTLRAQGAVTTLSYETTRIPARQACVMTPFRPVGEAALMTMASGCDEMMSSICDV